MRSIVIMIVAVVALSTIARGHPHFVPYPTGRMPPVNVPWCWIQWLRSGWRRLKC